MAESGETKMMEASEDQIKVISSTQVSQAEEGVVEGTAIPTARGAGKKGGIDKLAKSTIKELDSALKEAQDLLSARDEEVAQLKSELEHYRNQAAKEVANKTKLAQSLDESTRHATELEDALEKWQLSVKEYQHQVKQLEAALIEERSHSVELETRFSELYDKKNKEFEQLKVQLIEARKHVSGKHRDKLSSSKGGELVDDSQLMFLKQAVYHILIDSRPEEHLRAILSILNFSVEERKAVYAKFQEKGLHNTRN